MAVDLTITPSAPPLVVTVPQPGDLRKAASVVLFAQQLADYAEATYRRTRRAQYDITNAPFNADPTGGASSQAAITAAIAAAAATNGDVIVPPGTYLHTGLSVPDGVCIYAAQGADLFNTDAASSSIVFTQSNEGPPSVIEGLRFHASNPNTGNVINNNAEARVIFRRCNFNGYANGGGYFTNLRGKLAATGTSGSRLIFEDCDLVVGGALQGLHCVQGRISMRGGSLVMPATYGVALAQADGGELQLDRVRCDVRLHASGTAQILYATSSATISTMRGCVIDDVGAAGTIYAHLWVAGARVSYGSNLYTGTLVVPHGNSTAALGSRIEKEPTLAIDIGSAPTVDLTNMGRFKSILVNGTAACVVTLPAGLAPGDELLYTHVNADAAAHNITFSGTPITSAALPGASTLPAGNTLSSVFVWESRDVSGSYRWVQKGTWGVGLTLV